MLNQNLSDALQVAVNGGATVGSGANYFDQSAVMAPPPPGSKVIIKAHGVRFERTNQGYISVVYDVKENTLGIKSIPKSHLFGKHFTRTSGKFAMNEIECRTSGFDPSWGEVCQAQFKEKGSERLQTIDIWDPEVDIEVTYGALPTVFVANGRDAWDKTTRKMDMSKEKTNYATLTLSKA
jgi:hypothetical protein